MDLPPLVFATSHLESLDEYKAGSRIGIDNWDVLSDEQMSNG